MTNAPDPRGQTKGPTVYENWRAQQLDTPLREGREYPLFTDAHIVGVITDGYGPYRLLNTIAAVAFGFGAVAPAIALQIQIHVGDELPSMDRTDYRMYHGGGISDEFAAIVSLALGMRLEAGPMWRLFALDGDPRGRPTAYYGHSGPTMLSTHSRRILPACSGTRRLEHLDLLKSLPELSPVHAGALVLCARLYQQAVWVVESQPALAWLLLVSAVETAANCWDRHEQTATEKLKASKPELVKKLRSEYGEASVELVAPYLGELVGATTKFLAFLLEFKPLPPPKRPPEGLQVKWTIGGLNRALRQIYKYRSIQLHTGISFPAPLCYPPMGHAEWKAPEEKPLGLATSVGPSTWLAKDLPMHLHVFEHLVRGALLNWWRSLSNAS